MSPDPKAMERAREIAEDLGPIPERLWPPIIAAALEDHARAAVEQEREACAMVAKLYATGNPMRRAAFLDVVDSIRARGQRTTGGVDAGI